MWSVLDASQPWGCWLYTGGTLDRDGYPHITIGIDGHRFSPALSRVVLALTTGRWPDEHTLHTCDVPLCAAPAHLYEGDAARNARDRAERGRGITGRRWHEVHDATRITPERAPKAVMTWASVRTLRAEHATGQWTQTALAERYGIAQPTVSQIIRGVTWRPTA